MNGKVYDISAEKKKRKKHGQYYTDPSIVRFMLSKLENINENKSILDPACGYGIFLQEYYNIAKNSMLKNGYNEDHINEILLDKIWGLDIDPYAIQVASKNILSQNPKGSQQKTNINCKNSLERKIVLSKKFDYIVGNPPFYIVDATKQPYNSFLKSGFYDKILNNNLNIASLFLFGYSNQLKEHGQLTFVFPRSLIHVNSFKTLRKEILGLKIQYIFDIGRAFKDVGLEQLILILKNEDPSNNQIHYGLLDYDMNNSKIVEKLSYEISQDYFYSSENNVFEVFSGYKPGMATTGKDIKEKMITLAKGNTVLDYCKDIKRGLGIQKRSSKSRQKNTDFVIIGGRSIFNFGKKGQETYKYVDRTEIIKENIPIKVKLNLVKPKIMLQNLVSSKIRIVGCIDESPLSTDFDIEGTMLPIYMLTFDTITNLYLKDLRYARFLLGILLSELITYFLRDIIMVRATLTLHLDKKYLDKIPIVEPTASQLNEIDNIVRKLEKFVEKRQKLYPVKTRERPKWEKPQHSDYKDYKKLIDELDDKVYDLYEITPEEKAFIKIQLKEFEDYY